MNSRLEADTVRAALRVPAVLARFGVEYRDRPEIRLAVCPACGQRQRRASVVIDRESGRWIHHGGASSAGASCRGDAFDLVAAYAGLDARRDFPRVLELAAQIAGVTEYTSLSDLREIRARSARKQATYERELAAKRSAATAAVPGRWGSLARRSVEGERYLTDRGLDPLELIARDVVRFDHDDPAVALHAHDGAIVNIARRRRDPAADVKAPVLANCTTDGILVGRVDEIDCSGGGPDVAVLVEGITDTLAGVLAFSGCVVAGAHCADRLPHVADAVAPRLVAARGWLLIVPHVDGGKGEECAANAVRVASRAGLRLDESIHLVDVRPHKDLADAVRAGWRWRWP